MSRAIPYRALFFDLDDTLFDYAAAESAALQAACREFAVPVPLPAFLAAYRRHNQAVWQAYEQGLIDQVTLRTERFSRLFNEMELAAHPVPRFSECYLFHLAHQAHLLPEALATVRRLAPRFSLALVTNGIAAVQRPRLSASPLVAFFPLVVISEEVGCAKPDPRIFHPAMQAWNLAAGEVLFIGDSVSGDMAAAARAGMDFCWYNPRRLPLPQAGAARYDIASLGELPPLLGC